jgi:Arc/MetJ-type ribon-helix-helix transcriptional regulator
MLMPYPFPPDVDQLVRTRMATGNYGSEDDLLRHALEALAEQEDDLVAVREALAELAAGDPGQPLDVAFREIRQRCEPPSGA